MKKILLILTAALILSSSANAKTLVAYFSFPINNGKESLDASSGASVVPGTNGAAKKRRHNSRRAAFRIIRQLPFRIL